MSQPRGNEPTFFVGSAPTSATVSTASIQVVAQNNRRVFLSVKNFGATTISLAFGANPAVANRGVVLASGEGFTFDRGAMSREAVRAISSAGGGTLAIQEGSGA